MRYVRQYVQETVHARTPQEFDMQMNMIFTKAARGGKEPDVHFYGDSFTATVRYWITKDIPETLSDEFEMRGEGKKCFECPLYSAPDDKRIKYTHCEHVPAKISANDCACDYYYEHFERRLPDETKTVSIAKKSVLSK